jgi:hypothetical protein
MGGNIKVDFMEVGVQIGRWMELAQNGGQWQSLVLTSRKREFYD